MPAEGNCEGAAWRAGQELGKHAYASWDGRKRIIWLGINGEIYKSSFQRTEARRVKVLEARFGDIGAIVSIPQQAVNNYHAPQIGTLEILSSSVNKSYGRINVSIKEAASSSFWPMIY